MSKRKYPGKKNRQVTTGKTADSRRNAAARRQDLAKRLNEAPQVNPPESSPPPAPDKPKTAPVPVKKTAIKRAVPAKKTAVQKGTGKNSSFEVLKKSPDSQAKGSAPLTEDDLTTAPIKEKEIVESSKITLKAPGARGPEEQSDEIEDAGVLEPVQQPEQKEEKIIKPAAAPSMQRPKTDVPLRKETMRVSLKAPGAQAANDPPPPQEPVPVSKSSVPLRKETMRVSLKAPSADSPPPPAAEPVAPEAPVSPPDPGTATPQVAPEEQAYQPKKEENVPVRKETIRVSLKAPVTEENDPMENPDLLEPRKLSERAKEDPNQKYAPPGLQNAPAANLDQILEPAQMLEPEPEPEPEQVPMSLDEALPLRKETMRVSVKAPFAGMAAAQAAAAREPILQTTSSAPEPEPAPAVVLEQSTAAVNVISPNAAPPPPRQKVQQPSSGLDTPLAPAPAKPKKNLGSTLMTWVCILLGIVAAVMVYLIFTM